MASGNTLATFTPKSNQPPSSNAATFDLRNGHLVLEFDQTTIETAVFPGTLPRNYAGGGLTVRIEWMGDGVTTGDVVWGASFERHDAAGTDLDSDSFAAEQTATGTTAGTDGAVRYTAITFTDGAQIDSLAVSEGYRLKIRRVASDGSDTMAADAQLLRVEVQET